VCKIWWYISAFYVRCQLKSLDISDQRDFANNHGTRLRAATTHQEEEEKEFYFKATY
jgi:hypothetical protein